MSISNNRKLQQSNSILGFTYPKLHTGKSWYVDFTAFDPAQGKMRRKKIMLDGIAKITDRRKRAAELIEALLRQLRCGWSPWVNQTESRAFTPFADCISYYLSYIEKSSRKKTFQSYSSRVQVMEEFMQSCLVPIKYAYQFDECFVTQFLDYIFLDRDATPRTRNNYRGWCGSFAQFLISRKYISENPIINIPKIKEDVKFRKDLSATMLQTLQRTLIKDDPHYLLACYMEYYTFIRPTELSFLRISDISIEHQTILVHAEFSKNHRDALVGLNDTIIKLMINLNIFANPNDYYLFGKNFIPSRERIHPDKFNKHWVKLRKKLHWSDCYQFYSLKDSGIRDLANAEGIVVARDQARHSDVSTTNRYIQGANTRVHDSTKKFKGGFD